MKKHSDKYRSIKPLWSLVRNYRFQSMFFSYFFSITVVMITICLVYAFFSYWIYSENQKDKMTYFTEKSLNQTANTLNLILSKVEQQFYIIENNGDIMEFVSLDLYNNETITNQLKREVVNRLFYLTADNAQTDSIFVYSYTNDEVGAWNDCKSLESFFDREFLKQMERQEGGYVKRDRYPDGTGPYIISITKEIVSPLGDRQGMAVINLDYEKLQEAVAAGEDVQAQNTIVSPDGTIIYSDNKDYENKAVSEIQSFSEIQSKTEENHQVSVWDKDVIVSAQSASNQYMVISETTWENTSPGGGNISLFLSGCVAGLLVSVILAFFVSVRMYRYVIELITIFKSPLDENISTSNEAESELQFVGQRIMSTLNHSQVIEKELAEKMTELKKAQAVALQTQINPHFLLNSLQLINLDLMRQAKGDTKSTLAIAILSDILRNNLNTTEYIVTLEHEFTQAKKYADMENLRSNNKYQVYWNVEEGLSELKTIKFIIQPILENCILHGLADSSKESREITVTAAREGHTICFTVSDNGNGMQTDQLEEIRKKLSDSHIPRNKHIGLCNVDMRIKLLCGSSYGLSLLSEADMGTTVTICHPILE